MRIGYSLAAAVLLLGPALGSIYPGGAYEGLYARGNRFAELNARDAYRDIYIRDAYALPNPYEYGPRLQARQVDPFLYADSNIYRRVPVPPRGRRPDRPSAQSVTSGASRTSRASIRIGPPQLRRPTPPPGPSIIRASAGSRKPPMPIWPSPRVAAPPIGRQDSPPTYGGAARPAGSILRQNSGTNPATGIASELEHDGATALGRRPSIESRPGSGHASLAAHLDQVGEEGVVGLEHALSRFGGGGRGRGAGGRGAGRAGALARVNGEPMRVGGGMRRVNTTPGSFVRDEELAVDAYEGLDALAANRRRRGRHRGTRSSAGSRLSSSSHSSHSSSSSSDGFSSTDEFDDARSDIDGDARKRYKSGQGKKKDPKANRDPKKLKSTKPWNAFGLGITAIGATVGGGAAVEGTIASVKGADASEVSAKAGLLGAQASMMSAEAGMKSANAATLSAQESVRSANASKEGADGTQLIAAVNFQTAKKQGVNVSQAKLAEEWASQEANGKNPFASAAAAARKRKRSYPPVVLYYDW